MKRPNSDLPTVHVDFNNTDTDGFVRLNTVGVTNDLARLNIALVDGLRLGATDNEYALEGTVRIPGREGVWRLQVDWDEFKQQVVREPLAMSERRSDRGDIVERSETFLETHVDVENFVHRRSEPKYFALRLSEGHKHYAAGFRFAVQLLNDDGRGEVVLYFKEPYADYNSGSLRVPSAVFAAALRQKPGSGDYVDEYGQSRTPF